MLNLSSDPIVVIESHLVSLGKKANRWCVPIPQEASLVLGKKTRYEVEFRPMGTLHGLKEVRVSEA